MIPELVHKTLQDGFATEIDRIISTAIELVNSVPFINVFMVIIFNAVYLNYLIHVIEMFVEIDSRLKSTALCIN